MQRSVRRQITSRLCKTPSECFFQTYSDNSYFFQLYANLFQPILAKEAQHPLILFQSYSGRYIGLAMWLRPYGKRLR